MRFFIIRQTPRGIEKIYIMTENTLFSMFAIFALFSALMVIRSKNPVYSVLFLILVFCNASGLLVLLDLDFFAVVFLVVYVGAVAVLFLFVVIMLDIKISEMNENILRYLPIGAFIGFIFLFEMFLMLGGEFTSIHGTPKFPLLEIESILLHIRFFASSSFPLAGALLFSPWTCLETLDRWLSEYGRLRRVLNNLRELKCSESFMVQDYTLWPDEVEEIDTIEAIGQVVYTYYAFFFIVASLILLIAMIGAIQLTLQRGLPLKKQEVFEQNARDFAKTVVRITR